MKNIFNFLKKNTAINEYKKINSSPNIESNSLITFDELSKIPINKVIQILPDKDGAIETTRLFNEKGDLTFRIYMQKDEIWNFHHHDCEEVLIVFKGGLKVSISNKEYYKGQLFKIKKNVRHGVQALVDSIFYVEFKKP
jgi:quercetin dioxygenase-like cupin family protein